MRILKKILGGAAKKKKRANDKPAKKASKKKKPSKKKSAGKTTSKGAAKKKKTHKTSKKAKKRTTRKSPSKKASQKKTSKAQKKSPVKKATSTRKKKTSRKSTEKAGRTAEKKTSKNALKKAKKAKRTVKKSTKKTAKARKTQKKSSSKKASKAKGVPKKVVKKKVPKNTSKKIFKKTSKKPLAKKIVKSPKKKKAQAAKPDKKQAQEKKPLEQSTNPKRKQTKKITYPVVQGSDSPLLSTTIKALKSISRTKSVSDWRINYIHRKSASIYSGKKCQRENQIRGEREEIIVTLYHKDKEGLGEAIIPITDESGLKESLELGAQLCRHTKKPPYDLPRPQRVSFPESADMDFWQMLWSDDPWDAPNSIFEEGRNALTSQDILTNSFEVLCGASANRVISSTGIDVSWHKTAVHLEVTITAKSDDREEEFFWERTAVSPKQLMTGQSLTQQARIARETVSAQAAQRFTGDVLVSGNALTDIFAPMDSENPLIVHASARLHAMNMSKYKLGKPIGDFRGEPFTVISDPGLHWGLISQPVDEDGTPLKPIEIIRTGVFSNMITTPRYQPLVNQPVTGQASNVHVNDGATREEHLRGNNYVEIISFSWFNPDTLSGDFSAEIRLGYYWFRGKKKVFRGGTFSGNIFENFLNARFSREVIQSGRYYGPRAVLFKDARIVKG